MFEIKNLAGEVIYKYVGDSLFEANLARANLSGADLSGANLSLATVLIGNVGRHIK